MKNNFENIIYFVSANDCEKEETFPLNKDQLVKMMENIHPSADIHGYAQIAWAAWRSNMVSWKDANDACAMFSIAGPVHYWSDYQN